MRIIRNNQSTSNQTIKNNYFLTVQAHSSFTEGVRGRPTTTAPCRGSMGLGASRRPCENAANATALKHFPFHLYVTDSSQRNDTYFFRSTRWTGEQPNSL